MVDRHRSQIKALASAELILAELISCSNWSPFISRDGEADNLSIGLRPEHLITIQQSQCQAWLL